MLAAIAQTCERFDNYDNEHRNDWVNNFVDQHQVRVDNSLETTIISNHKVQLVFNFFTVPWYI